MRRAIASSRTATARSQAETASWPIRSPSTRRAGSSRRATRTRSASIPGTRAEARRRSSSSTRSIGTSSCRGVLQRVRNGSSATGATSRRTALGPGRLERRRRRLDREDLRMSAPALAGLALLNGLYLASGVSLLWLVRGWDTWAELGRLAGLAYVGGCGRRGLGLDATAHRRRALLAGGRDRVARRRSPWAAGPSRDDASGRALPSGTAQGGAQRAGGCDRHLRVRAPSRRVLPWSSPLGPVLVGRAGHSGFPRRRRSTGSESSMWASSRTYPARRIRRSSRSSTPPHSMRWGAPTSSPCASSTGSSESVSYGARGRPRRTRAGLDPVAVCPSS